MIVMVLAAQAQAAPQCKLDGKKIKWPNHTSLLALDKAFVGAHWDAKQGIVLTNLETGAAFGKPVALPESPAGSVRAFTRVKDGVVVIVRLSKSSDDEGGRLFLARFASDGTPIGQPHEIAHEVAPIPMAGLDVVAVGDRLALMEETKALKHSQVQMIDLDGKAIGPAVDAEAGRISSASTAIGIDGKAIAVLLRDSEGGQERLRVFDVAKNAWVGAAVPMGDMHIYAAAPFGASAVLMGIHDGLSLATVGADGKLGAWKLAKKLDLYDSGRWIASSPDAKRTFVEYSVKSGADAKETDVLAIVQPDLSLRDDARHPSKGFSSADPYVTATTLYVADGNDYLALRCKR
jgi:hypothetical protein